MVKHAKELEDERNEKRNLISETERLAFKAQVAEDDRQKLLLKIEKRQSEVNSTLAEKNSLSGLLREKDLLIESL